MSPAQQQLALALVERMAKQLHDEYLESSARHLAMFEELCQVNKLRDDLRVEIASVGQVPVAECPLCPSSAEVLS